MGWLNWRPNETDGPLITTQFASGFVYGANIGWINLGDGSPANGTSYSNTSAGDFGVNVDATSDPDYYLLSGYAWSANCGWINFDVEAQAGSANQPRIEKATNILRGYAWGANIGWLTLDSFDTAYVTIFFPSGFEASKTGIDPATFMLYE